MPGRLSIGSFTSIREWFLPRTVHGTDGDDTIYGGWRNDHLFGGRGNDTIYGNSGNDEIDGEEGNDRLYGGGGADRMRGGSGDDYMSGGTGNDQLLGGDGNDRQDGGAGNDEVYGEAGNDALNGNDGDDEINGGEGNDYLSGGAGNDFLFGAQGQDVMTGGAGADTFLLNYPTSWYGSATEPFDTITDWNASEDHIHAALQLNGTSTVSNFTYAEFAGNVNSIEEAQALANLLYSQGQMSANTANVFIYNSATNTGYLLQDVYQDTGPVFETGVTLLGAGYESDFSAANLV